MPDQQPYTAKECHFFSQGIQALLNETAAQKAACVLKMFPADNNLATLIEYYDKRNVELQALLSKINAEII